MHQKRTYSGLLTHTDTPQCPEGENDDNKYPPEKQYPGTTKHIAKPSIDGFSGSSRTNLGFENQKYQMPEGLGIGGAPHAQDASFMSANISAVHALINKKNNSGP